ncbi:MAG: hypothetical protein EP340_07440 [Alphaproteobacteria bacterium]|nr:MAG: hypothetical protein EP340_07440 [Alphaproteobacteria bacterium]
MSLESFYYLSQIVAVLLILASLIAIYLQQRQANTIARAEMTQTAQFEYAATLREIMNNEDLATAFRKVMIEPQPLTPTETTRILIYFNLTMGVSGNSYYLTKHKLVDPSYIRDSEQNVLWYLTAPEFAREWRRSQRRNIFSREFVEHINEQFAKHYPDHDASTLFA